MAATGAPSAGVYSGQPDFPAFQREAKKEQDEKWRKYDAELHAKMYPEKDYWRGDFALKITIIITMTGLLLASVITCACFHLIVPAIVKLIV